MTDLADVDASLAAGRDHERAGRLLDAVAEYDRARRLRPDSALAQHIVRLRHEAAAQLPPSAGAAVWPPVRPDPFPGHCGAPEITRDELDADVLGGAIAHHGCLIVRGLEDTEQALALRERVVRSIEARDRIVDGEPASGDDDWYRPFEPWPQATKPERSWVREAGGMLTADSPLLMCELLDELGRSGVIDAITAHLGEPAVLTFNKCVLRRLRHSSPTWHQDGKFMGSSVRTVDVWLALSDCGAGTDTPGLDIVPKRFEDLLATQTDGAIFPNSIGQGLVDRVAADRPWVTPTFAVGDAILFDERFVHRSQVGDFGVDRYAIETWFFAASTSPEKYAPIAV